MTSTLLSASIARAEPSGLNAAPDRPKVDRRVRPLGLALATDSDEAMPVSRIAPSVAPVAESQITTAPLDSIANCLWFGLSVSGMPLPALSLYSGVGSPAPGFTCQQT